MSKAHTSKSTLAVGLLLATAVAGAALLSWLTPHGIGLYYDSMAYLEAAENLVDGPGLGRITCETYKPLTRYPPFYPLMLSSFHAARMDVTSAARLLSALALGLVCFLAGATVWRASRSVSLAVACACWVLLSTPVLSVFSWAMSEPLYLALWLGSILGADAYLSTGRQRDLWLAAALAALAFLTRFVGVLPILVSASLIGLEAARRTRAWRDLVIYLGVSCLPMLAWLARGVLVAGNPTSRDAAIHLPSREVLRQGADTIISWFGAGSGLRSEEAVAATLAGLAIALAVPCLAVILRPPSLSGRSRVALLHLLGGLAYVLGVLVSITFFDDKTPLDDRILIPTYLSLGVVVLIAVSEGVRRRSPLIAGLAVLAFLGLSGRTLLQAKATISRLRADGQGYAASVWVNSDLGRRLRELDPATVFTNDITAVYFVADLPSCAIPTKNAEDSLTAMREGLKANDAVLALFGKLSSEFMPLERLTEGLEQREELRDGTIYMTGLTGGEEPQSWLAVSARPVCHD